MLEATPAETVTAVGYDIACLACGMPVTYVEAGRLELLVEAHRLPVLFSVHVRHRGRDQVWVCRDPRPLTT